MSDGKLPFDDHPKAKQMTRSPSTVWLPHVPENPNGSGSMVWADGAALVAEQHHGPTNFFERHPYFERAEPDTGRHGVEATRVWLTQREPAEEDVPELPRALPRPHDLLLTGILDPGYEIFAVHPDVEALEYIWSDGDGPQADGAGPFPDVWQAKIWLRS